MKDGKKKEKENEGRKQTKEGRKKPMKKKEET